MIQGATPGVENDTSKSAIATRATAATTGSKTKTPTSIETQAQKQRREVIRQLSRGKSLEPLVADPTRFDLRQACRVAKIALEEDPEFDKKLKDLVKSGAASETDQIIRVLAVLESICSPSRLLAHILDLKQMEGRVKSKLTLMVGRLTRDPQWLRQQLEDESPRVRANAIEGLWDVRAEGLEKLLRAALKDPHHRVAANAALALHKLGDVCAIRSTYAMLRHPDPMFRRAALWAVGQTRDPRFQTAVAEIERNAIGEEAVMAAKVKEELRISQVASEFTAALSLEISQDRVLESGERRVRLCCVAEQIGGWLGPMELDALNFIIREGERQIEDYRLEWVIEDQPFVALIVQPLSWNGCGELLKPALRGAGVGEIYGFLPYQTPNSEVRGKEDDDASEVKFENYLEMSKEYLGRTYDVAKNLCTAIEIGLTTVQKQDGRKHICILADPSLADCGALTCAVPDVLGETRVHVVVWDQATAALRDSLRTLSTCFGGRFTIASSAREFTKMLMSVRAAHFGNFELTWKPTVMKQKSPAHIHCRSAFGTGSVVLA